jgi:uncharacterized NAD(P)/FAD-binding protein YdhS
VVLHEFSFASLDVKALAMKTIAVVGGGFSGTMTAVNVARFAEAPVRIVIINRGFPRGRGVAYSTARPEHLLNVVARNMSALADQPNHFIEWLRTRTEYADTPVPVLREMFIPRRIYGDYLASLLFAFAQPIAGRAGVRIDTVDGEAVDIIENGNGGTVVLADGSRLEANKVLLATGNQPPAEFGNNGEPFRHPRYCESPWVNWEQRLPDRRENVILLGTGLTTVDAFLTLSSQNWEGTIFAVSRNGLLPQSHFRGIEYPNFPPSDPSRLGLHGLVELVEEHCGRLRGLGANPAIVIDKLRPHTQRIWQEFSLEERQEFCKRYASRWNVTRHRIAQEIHQRVTAAIASGRMQIVKGKIEAVEAVGERVWVTVEGAGGSRVQLEGGLVINCTGPNTGFSASAPPLFHNLLAKGMIAVDDMDMGIRVDGDFAAIGSDGVPSSLLKAMGPLIKGTLWETTAVPELRGQALRIAQMLVDEIASHERREWPAQPEVDLVEYCI